MKNTELVLADKRHVCIFFSAQWCAPCRSFTPVAVAKYKEVIQTGELEVVFVSSDRDQPTFDRYCSEMPWLSLPFADRERKDALALLFNVRGIPTMVRLDGRTGEVQDTNCRSAILMATSAEALLDKWSKPKAPSGSETSNGNAAANKPAAIVNVDRKEKCCVAM